MDRGQQTDSDTSMHLSIRSTTAARFELHVPLQETVDGLKKRLAQKLRLPKDRLLLLFRETRLGSGKLQDFGVRDGSRLMLVPTVEAGLLSQAWCPEQSVLQALESLTDAQVSDFLSGHSPLTLALRVGDHIMFVQLQLAAEKTGGPHHTLSVSRGLTDTSQTPAGMGSSEYPQNLTCSSRAPSSPQQDLKMFKIHPAPPHHPAPRVHHTHSVCSHAPTMPCLQPDNGARQNHKTGAVIESLVSRAPGVFSGTFSGMLHPSCQDNSGRPHRDITTILQILNDLLSATRHYQGTPPSPAHLHCPPASPRSPPSSPTSDRQQIAQMLRSTGEGMRQTENKATRCKVEQLRLLLQQRRLRRKARRDTRRPYQWPADRKAACRHCNSNLSSEGSPDLDFGESVWKPEVQSDRNTEFVVA